MAFKRSAQTIHVSDKIFDLLFLQPGGIADGAHDVRRAEMQLPPDLCQMDPNLAFVGSVPTSLDIPERL